MAPGSGPSTNSRARKRRPSSCLWQPRAARTCLEGLNKLIKIGANVVRYGRYVTLQLAEVAIPRDLFAEILRRIDRLRPASVPP